jgi:hypothetical protein
MKHKYMTHKYAPRYVYILFHKMFLTFERYLAIWLSKCVFIFAGFFNCDLVIGQFSTWVL